MSRHREELQLTVRYRGRHVGNHVVAPGRAALPGLPLEVNSRRTPTGFEVDSPDGAQAVDPTAMLTHGDVQVEVGRVRRFRLARWMAQQGDAVLPLLVLAATLFVAQANLLVAVLMLFFGGAGGGAVPEPSPEYIARLLDEQYNGAEHGVYALGADRPKSETKVETYYLQPGSDGPRTRMGGGKNVGPKRKDGNPEAKGVKAAGDTTVVVELGDSLASPGEDAVAVAEEGGTAEADADGEDQAVEVTEGWGLTDWYDTEDARKDAKRIEQELRYAKQLIRLDPNDLYGLQIRAYYEYLAMDFDAADRTYAHMLKVAPEDGGTWNNIALLYKRKKDYAKEEQLYYVSLGHQPDEPNTLNNLAVCVAHQGRYDEALQIMKRLETMTPDEPYADLHRAKIYAMMGKEEVSYKYLRKSLASMRKLDTLHNIEYQQDIRVDPAFEAMRKTERFHKLLLRYYGDRANGWWIFPGKP